MKRIEVTNQKELNAAIKKHNGALHIVVNKWNDIDLIVAGNVAGNVEIYDNIAGTVDIYGSAKVGSVEITGNVAGTVYIYGNVAGSVDIYGSAKVGSVDISGDVAGSVDIYGSVTGSVDISGNVAGYKVNSPEQEKALLLKIKEIILKNPDLLEMHSWHCGTTHCLGGYAIALDERGKEIESATHSSIAATVLLPSSSKYFHKSKEEVIKYLNTIN